MDGIGLAGFVPFNSLSDEALAQAAAVVREIRLATGQHLFHRGDADVFRYYLIEGRVALDAGDGSPPLLVQAGSAVQIVSEAQAREIFALMNEMDGEEEIRA